MLVDTSWNNAIYNHNISNLQPQYFNDRSSSFAPTFIAYAYNFSFCGNPVWNNRRAVDGTTS
jgi:hypothetical protein